jgi:D-serine deaminase-like pyridoxal phosphate-dependent protein
VDSTEGARLLSEAFSSVGRTIDYLIEIDTGLNRCGVPPGEPALALFREIHRLPGIRFRGIFTHAGQVYGALSLEEVREVSRQESRVMTETARLFADLDATPGVVSVGSTPTMWVWEGFGEGITEIRPGNYIFNDATQVALGVAGVEDCALTVMATVISCPGPHRAVIDAGSKVLGLDRGAHGKGLLKGFGRLLGGNAILERLSEEHGILRLSPGDDLRIGDRVRILPNHACTVMNLMDRAYGLMGEEVVEEFTIAARGKVQ